MDIYQAIVRPLLFSGLRTDPEWLHQQTMQALKWLESSDRLTASWVQRRLQHSLCVQDPRLAQTLWGLQFPNPVGLAAGFDKDGIAGPLWSSLGFGFAELGTVTLQPQPGNPRPRLFRLPQDKAALNRMGFNNSGAAAMAARLANQNRAVLPTPIGVNLGKSKVAPLEAAAADYLGSFRLLKDWADYFVVNVSSPNTPGLRSLQEAAQLGTILDALQQENQGQKPVFVKIAPDLTWEAIADILAISQTYQMAGIVATNTTVSREGLKTQFISPTGIPRWRRHSSEGSVSDGKMLPLNVHKETGGISGAPLRDRSTEIIRFIRQQTHGQLPIIGVGGIFTADDAWEKITAGASLIQVYTGWIYEGPWIVRRILEGLLQKLESQGLASISEAIGKES